MRSLCRLAALASAEGLAVDDAGSAASARLAGVTPVRPAGAEAERIGAAADAGVSDLAPAADPPEPKAGAADIASARLVVATALRTVIVDGDMADIIPDVELPAACALPDCRRW
jgi:hypothetical protein